METKDEKVTVEIDSPLYVVARATVQAARRGVTVNKLWVDAMKHYVFGEVELMKEAQSGTNDDE